MNFFKGRLEIHNSFKHLKPVKKLRFIATPTDNDLMVNFEGNIRHSLFFLIQVRSISQKAYDEAIVELNKCLYKLPKKLDNTPTTVTQKITEEEQKKQSSSFSSNGQSYGNSAQLLFSPPKDESVKNSIPTPARPACNV